MGNIDTSRIHDAFGKFEVEVTPVEIEFEGVRSEVMISMQDTAGLTIDDQVFFSGLSHDDLAELEGKRDRSLDFTVLSVGEPFTAIAEPVFPGEQRDSEAVSDPAPPRGDDGRAEREEHDLDYRPPVNPVPPDSHDSDPHDEEER